MRALLAILLAGLATAAQAADAPGRLIEAPEDYVYGCSASQANAVPFRDLQRNPQAFLRQCVRITGITPIGREIYADLSDFYRHMTQLIAFSPEGIGIGLYASNASKVELTERGEVEIIGRAFSCDEIAREVQQAEDEKYAGSAGPRPPVMLAGYCHYYGNAIIYVAQERILQPGPLRLTGPESARAVGDLEDLEPKDEIYSEVWKRATRWFDFVRRQSTPEYDDFMAGCGKTPPPTREAAAETRACREIKEKQLDALGRTQLPPIKFYVRKSNPPHRPQGEYAAFGCVCRIAKCDGLWPIHSIDTGSSAWPYFCAHVTNEGREFRVY